jgi:anti-anti-sigma factor
MALMIFTRRVGSALVFELRGSLDAAGAEKLFPQVSGALDAGEHLLIFDLAKLTYVSSMGLSVFLTAYRRLEGKGRVCFAGLQDLVRQVFNITGLGVRVQVYDTVEDALVGPVRTSTPAVTPFSPATRPPPAG